MIDPAQISTWVTAIGAALAGVVGTVLALRKRHEQDETEVKRHRAERGIMSDLMHERDVASGTVDRLRGELITALQDKANEKMKAQLLQGDLDQLQRRYDRLQHRASQLVKRLLDAGLMDPQDAPFALTSFGQLDDLTPQRPPGWKKEGQ